MRKFSKKQWIIAGISAAVICGAAGIGMIALQPKEPAAKEEKIPDEVAEIENINSRDNVVDESTAFKGEKPSPEDKKELEKAETAEKTKTAQKTNGDAQKPQSKPENSDANVQEKPNGENAGNIGEAEMPHSQNSGSIGDGAQSGGQNNAEEEGNGENPQEPEDKPIQIPEPGWTTGIY